MKKRAFWLATVALAMALAGCAGLAQAGENTSDPTISTGPVTIATDHSAYANNDVMTVTIVNHLSTPIYGYDTKASCSILTLEIQTNGQWQPANALRCPLGRIALPVKIDAGGTYQVTIGSTVSHIGSATPLADGTYRLAFEYYSAPFSGNARPPTATLANSASLTVNGSVPPSNTKEPHATPVQGTPGGSKP
jgi:hypothetical protein